MTAKYAQRAAIVGAGLMGRWHAHALRKVGVTIAAIVDSDIAKAQTLAARFEADAFESLDLALKEVRIGAAHICAPLATHEALAREAIEAGCHVLIEKPLALNAEITRNLFRFAESHGRHVCPVHQFLFQSGVIGAMDHLVEIEPIVRFDFRACSAGADGLEDSSRVQIAREILPHPLSLAAHFLKTPTAQLDWRVIHPRSGEITAYAESNFRTVSIAISMSGRPTCNELEIIGEHGSIEIDLYHGFSIRESGDVSRTRKLLHPFDQSARKFSGAAVNLLERTIQNEPAYPGLRELIGRFYDSINGAAPPPITAEAAIDLAEAQDKIVVLL